MKIETIADHGLSPGTPNKAIYPNTCTSLSQEKNRNILVHDDLVSNEVIHPNMYATLSHKKPISVPVPDFSTKTPDKMMLPNICALPSQEKIQTIPVHDDLATNKVMHPNTCASPPQEKIQAIPFHDLSTETPHNLSFENDIYDSGISENLPELVGAEKTFKDNSMFSIDSTVRDTGSESEEVLILPGSTCPPTYTTSVSKVLITNTFSTRVSPISPPKFLKHEALKPALTVDIKSNYVEFACEVAETSLLNDSGFAIGDDITVLETDDEFEI